MNLTNKIKYSTTQKIVIALSGGIDSIVLLHYFRKHNIRVIHINHNLSSNAINWQKFCHNYCLKLGINFKAIATHIEGKNNLEEKARTLRYQLLFANIADDELLFTAHHQSDQAETVILNLLRGSGTLGLSAMLMCGNKLHRPFLQTPKQQIKQYASKHNLEFVDDESNLDLKFRRNFIRHKVLPLIETKYPNAEKTLSRVADNNQQTQKLLEDLAKIDIDNYNITKDILLNITNLKKLPDHRIVNILFFHLKNLNFKTPSGAIIQQIINCLDAKKDAKVLIKWSDKFEIRSFAGFLYFLLIESSHECEILLDLRNKEGFNIKYKTNGLRIKFNHKNHSQSLKKIIQEHKIPPWEREKLKLYYIFDELVAIEKIGYL